MIELIVWIFLSALLGSFTLLIRYWFNLFRTRDSMIQDELVNFRKIIPAEFLTLFPHGEMQKGYLALALGVIISWLLLLLGGLFTPNSSPLPDFAENSITNYFFQSLLFPFLLHLAWPALKNALSSAPILKDIVRAETLFFFGLGISLAALSMMVWGVYHEVRFLFAFINCGAILLLVIYKLDRSKREEQSSESDDFPPGVSDEDLAEFDDGIIPEDDELPPPEAGEENR